LSPVAVGSVAGVEHPLDVRARVVRTVRLLVDGYGAGFSLISRECGVHYLTVAKIYHGTRKPEFETAAKLHDGMVRMLREREKVRELALHRDRELLQGAAIGLVGGKRGPKRAEVGGSEVKNIGENADESP